MEERRQTQSLIPGSGEAGDDKEGFRGSMFHVNRKLLAFGIILLVLIVGNAVSAKMSLSSYDTPSQQACVRGDCNNTYQPENATQHWKAASNISTPNNTVAKLPSSSSVGTRNPPKKKSTKKKKSPRPKEEVKTQYYFLHIPKNGGYSIQNLLRKSGVMVRNFGVHGPLNKNYDNMTKSLPEFHVFMTEYGYNQYQPKHSLVMIREPTSHVISQYFHCTESPAHRGRHRAMPKTLLEWAQRWKEIRDENPQIEYNMTNNPMSHWQDKRFKCYIPLNYQSWMTTFPKTKDDLRSLFDAVGIMDDMQGSICLYLVKIFERVPPQCDCTNESKELVKVARVDHGVKHHGNSYNITDEERKAIEEITNLDRVLYQQATEYYRELRAEAEKTYNVTLCGKKI